MAQNFTIVSQTETQVPGPDGRLVEAISISFETPSAGPFTETIPKALYNRDYVEETLSRFAAQIEEIQQL